jgi:hypothetical protein
MTQRKYQPEGDPHISKEEARAIGRRLAEKFGWDYDPYKTHSKKRKAQPVDNVAPIMDCDEGPFL